MPCPPVPNGARKARDIASKAKELSHALESGTSLSAIKALVEVICACFISTFSLHYLALPSLFGDSLSSYMQDSQSKASSELDSAEPTGSELLLQISKVRLEHAAIMTLCFCRA
jgi:hypothetical protein